MVLYVTQAWVRQGGGKGAGGDFCGGWEEPLNIKEKDIQGVEVSNMYNVKNTIPRLVTRAFHV